MPLVSMLRWKGNTKEHGDHHVGKRHFAFTDTRHRAHRRDCSFSSHGEDQKSEKKRSNFSLLVIFHAARLSPATAGILIFYSKSSPKVLFALHSNLVRLDMRRAALMTNRRSHCCTFAVLYVVSVTANLLRRLTTSHATKTADAGDVGKGEHRP